MPTKTTTITHEPWCASHDNSSGIETCGTSPIDLSDHLSVWVHASEGDTEPTVELDNADGVELSSAQAGSLAESIREDGTRLADALAETATALGGDDARCVGNPTGAAFASRAPQTPALVLERFRVQPKDSQHTHYEVDDDLRLRLARGGVADRHDEFEGGAVALLLDLDGCGVAVVKVDTHPNQRDLQAVEQALAHLTTVRDELRRLHRAP